MSFTMATWSEPTNQDHMTHHDLVTSWMGKRGQGFQDYAGIPARGCVVMKNGVPVAVMGLRLCEGGLGMIDTFCSDPDVDPQIRNEAADLLTGAILEMAEKLNLVGVLGISKDSNTLTRSFTYGFELSNQVLVSKRLRGKL